MSPRLQELFRLAAEICSVLLVLYAVILFSFVTPLPIAPATVAIAKVLFGAGLFASSTAFLFRRHGMRLADLAPPPPGSRPRAVLLLLAAYAGGLAMSSTGHFLANLHVYFPILPPPALGWWRFGSQTKDHYLLFGVLWIVHAFGEELFFRGYVYRRLKTLIAPRAAFWACVLVFCTAHLNDPANYLKLVVFSALITASYDYGRSFLMPVTMHSALNTFAFCRTIWVLERESAPPRVFLVLAINLLCCLTYWAISFRRDRLRQFARRLASRVR